MTDDLCPIHKTPRKWMTCQFCNGVGMYADEVCDNCYGSCGYPQCQACIDTTTFD